MNDSIVQIARLKAGRFDAYFDRVGDQFEITEEWFSKPGTTYRFETIESARKYWHDKVVDPKGFLHCHCC